MIELTDVTLAYGERTVLSGLNLRLEERRVGVVGSNGSGKSTFVRLLNGLLLPSQGQVLVGSLNTREKAKEVRRRVGFVFQAFNLVPTLTAEQNIVLPLELAGRRPDRASSSSASAKAGCSA